MLIYPDYTTIVSPCQTRIFRAAEEHR